MVVPGVGAAMPEHSKNRDLWDQTSVNHLTLNKSTEKWWSKTQKVEHKNTQSDGRGSVIHSYLPDTDHVFAKEKWAK